ncbi:RNA polymerase sigma-70 factor (ECF subfamily) [Parabacteroides sp. PF5-5]|uniref:RNA polymerase sigma factor n=1 Tax=unclassified Parabacteroides TaxID=2649774 RepID=UPI00247716DB|nr:MULTISPECIES: sigma-70 family RNA polymerase sigma factor [unclassified Parabacteroides]MDH6306501.1 RNA polymerase sigma-70 factor (ECF subfamily) [Parabacteroides sp. PH5-39]MDH6317468.1 RNA polymerase sigma-70 factor (ECF subfamily) [Parabacteroides sp. PF5-13]MDH6321229.1 RNA polymerase sigma-70 factor (ECF subfamily) [Parabacteroides sp. PH5-13]MDH6324961.1 RNA polymerase sigma-70 factor (ECF subfamily) [Parabacteroides sp. PH5-8]MDH6328670.1 RNA polymerase sigma-70 factor (ECF subfami
MENNDLENEFIALIEQNNGVIYRVATFYTDEDNPVGDLYQDIIINLWKGYPSFRNECKLSTWIYRVALNTCLAIYRRKKRKLSFVEMNWDIPIPDEDNEIINELYVLINRLQRVERALVLLYLEDKSYKEISDITGLSVTNVATKLSRIKEKLKQMNTNNL